MAAKQEIFAVVAVRDFIVASRTTRNHEPPGA